MWISKKKVLSLLKENLNEMAMEFDGQDRPHTDVQGDLERGETPYNKVPLPNTGNENQNFQELLASERYKEVIANIRQYVGDVQPISGERGMGPLMRLSMTALMSIIRTESAHRDELAQLAVELVKKELSIPEDAFEFDARIVGIGDIGTEGFNNAQPRNQEEPQNGGDEEGGEEDGEQQNPNNPVNIEKQLFSTFEKLSLEKAKRRFINGIIQGASDKGHYMYHYVADRIQQITGSQDIINQYGVMMAVNDSLYWQIGNQTLDQMMGGGEGGEASMAGREDVDRTNEVPKITARGVNFPTLVHELIKGVLEVFAIQGRPEDADEYSEVEQEEDTLAKENWDQRLGPAIWNRIRAVFPDKIMEDETQFEIQNYLLVEIFKLPPKQFFTFMREVLMKTERGYAMMEDLVDGIYKMLNDLDYNEETEDFHEELNNAVREISDEDMNSFLQSLGINMDIGGDFDVNEPDDNRRN